MGNQILTEKNQLDELRKKQTQDWLKSRFYKFLTNLFKDKTTFEKYLIWIILAQLFSLILSYISFVTGKHFINDFYSNWIPFNGGSVIATWATIIVIEGVKMGLGLMFFIAILRLRIRQAIMIGVLIACIFYVSISGSIKGAIMKVDQQTAIPELIDTEKLKAGYDIQIAANEAKIQNYLTSDEYVNSNGERYHTAIEKASNLEKTNAELLTTKETRLTEANAKNENTTLLLNAATKVDKKTMALIAGGADAGKLFISFWTALFFITCAREHDVLNAENDDNGGPDLPPGAKIDPENEYHQFFPGNHSLNGSGVGNHASNSTGPSLAHSNVKKTIENLVAPEIEVETVPILIYIEKLIKNACQCWKRSFPKSVEFPYGRATKLARESNYNNAIKHFKELQSLGYAIYLNKDNPSLIEIVLVGDKATIFDYESAKAV